MGFDIPFERLTKKRHRERARKFEIYEDGERKTEKESERESMRETATERQSHIHADKETEESSREIKIIKQTALLSNYPPPPPPNKTPSPPPPASLPLSKRSVQLKG